jgi:Sulfotransferase family
LGLTVLYIGGCTRSGSTLLDRMLGQLPGIVSTGEFGLITTHCLTVNRLCGCGKPFLDCEFWNEVGRRAYGGWDTDEARELIALHPRVTRQRHIPFIVLSRFTIRFRRDLRRYRELLTPLYRALAEVGKAEIIVDSTKAPAYAFVLRGVRGIELRTLHLVRDSRGTAYSAGKVQVMKDSVEKVVYKDRYPPAVITVRWMLYHLLFDLQSLVDHRTIDFRYEDVVRDPRGFMRRVLAWLGRDTTDAELAFIGPGSVELAINHTIAGSDMRLDNGRLTLREDDKWRTALHPASRRLVTLMSWPFLKRWRYALRASKPA